jgi:hypothetical protein
MATSDGESCSAEDRALTAWEMQPWGDADGDEGNPWSTLERAVETTRARFVARYQDAFRAGFRAGQEEAYKLPPPVPEHETAAWALMVLKRIEALEQFTPERGVAAGSQLGVELSKIRDRLNALENPIG